MVECKDSTSQGLLDAFLLVLEEYQISLPQIMGICTGMYPETKG